MMKTHMKQSKEKTGHMAKNKLVTSLKSWKKQEQKTEIEYATNIKVEENMNEKLTKYILQKGAYQ